MKTILIPIKPKYAALEMNGIKTIEVRKFYIEPPFKVVNYVTKEKPYIKDFATYNAEHCKGKNYNRFISFNEQYNNNYTINGKVAYEYVIRDVSTLNIVGVEFFGVKDTLLKKACFTHSSLAQYVGSDSKNFYAWHISELKIYDKPKELGEFNGYCKKKQECYLDIVRHCNEVHFDWKCNPVKRAPRNYIYVEEI